MDTQKLIAKANFLNGMAEGIKWVVQEAEKENEQKAKEQQPDLEVKIN